MRDSASTLCANAARPREGRFAARTPEAQVVIRLGPIGAIHRSPAKLRHGFPSLSSRASVMARFSRASGSPEDAFTAPRNSRSATARSPCSKRPIRRPNSSRPVSQRLVPVPEGRVMQPSAVRIANTAENLPPQRPRVWFIAASSACRCSDVVDARSVIDERKLSIFSMESAQITFITK